MKYSLIIQRVLIFLAIYFLVTIRSDGYFPFNANQNQDFLLLTSLINVFAIFCLLILFFNLDRLLLPKLIQFIKDRLLAITSILSTSLILLTVFLYYKNYLVFKDSYSFNLPVVGIITLLTIGIVTGSLVLRRAKLALISVFVASFALSTIPITYFPIVSKIGDLIPIIQKQLESFVSGRNIYQYYLLDNGVLTQAVRQPGTTLSYLPAYLLKIDLRWMGILFTFATSFVFLKIIYKNFSEIKFDEKFLISFILIALLLLSPYRLNRLDVYEPVFWFLLTLVIYLIKSKKFILSSIVWGLGIFTQVWFWLFTPFYLVYLYKKFGLKRTLYLSAFWIIIGVIPLALFVLRDINAYYQNVFGYYGSLVNTGQFSINSFYLTPIIIKAGLNKLVTFFQGSFVFLTLLAFLKSKLNLKSFLMYIILGFFLFIQFNSLTWNYMYMDLFIFLGIYIIDLMSENIVQ